MAHIRLRASILTSWNDCPRRSAVKLFRDDIKEEFRLNPEIRRVDAAVGTGFHGGAEYAMKEKMGGNAAKRSEVEEASIARFRDEIEAGVSWDDITPNPNHAEKQLRALAGAFMEFVEPAIDDPIAVEPDLEADLGEGFILTGHPDVIERSEGIWDYKTGKVKNHQPQMGGYSLLAKSNRIPVSNSLTIVNIQRAPIRARVAPRPPIMSAYDAKSCEQEVRNILKAIKHQHQQYTETSNPMSFPANPNSMLCSKRYCPAHGTDFCPMTK